MMPVRPLVFLIFAFAILAALPATAQISLPPTAGQLLLRLNPSNPEPGSNVRVTLSSLSFDLSEAGIAWYVDEQIVAGGRGVTAADVRVGASGEATHVAAYVVANGAAIGSAEVYIRPAEVDILWESDAYTPLLYPGKKLASSGSTIRVEAIARLRDAAGTAVRRGDIIYTWHRNGALIKSASGRGKSSASFPAPQLFGTDTIAVEASTLDGTMSAGAIIRIPSIDSSVVLYQDHPLFGVLYNSALSRSATFPDVEITLAAVPYFAPNIFSPRDGVLTYEWRVNGTSVPTDATHPDRLTINAENSSGRARLELLVSHLTDIVMSAGGRWDILLNSGLGGTGVDPFAPKTSI